MTLLFYPNFFRGKLSPNKIGLFLIRRHSLNIKIGEEIREDRIVRRGPNWGQRFLQYLVVVRPKHHRVISFITAAATTEPYDKPTTAAHYTTPHLLPAAQHCQGGHEN